jgi:hypothetical protein
MDTIMDFIGEAGALTVGTFGGLVETHTVSYSQSITVRSSLPNAS